MPQTQYGVCIPIFACPGPQLFRTPGFERIDPEAALMFGRKAEELGYDSVWVADHLMLGKGEAILEGWTVLAAIAGATSRVKLGMIHMSQYFRHPSLTAKMIATLDRISGGRVIFFMDCGYQGREYVNFGLPWEDDFEIRAAHLEEAHDLIHTLWTDIGLVSYKGERWDVSNAVFAPLPLQEPYPPIWFGETHPAVLNICARRGDGWNTVPVSIEELRHRLCLLKTACDEVGRDVDEIEISLETQILIAPDIPTLREKLGHLVELGGNQNHLPPENVPFIHDYAKDPATTAFLAGETDELPEPMATDWIIGTPEQVKSRIDDYTREGVDHFMFWFMDAPSLDGIELLARMLRS